MEAREARLLDGDGDLLRRGNRPSPQPIGVKCLVFW
jgi:hypothetical protein